jgi:8-oxo-dGTP pyrophosphatase MutT (NUDIX family)
VSGDGEARPADRLAPVVAAVWGRRPVDGREARARHRMLVALGRLPHPFDRERDVTHVTGSSLIIGRRGVILHRHKRLGLWLQPGGHLDPGETPWEAARRESTEETGLQVDWLDRGPGGVPRLAHLDVHAGGRGHIHLDLRYLVAVVGSDEPVPPEGESQDVRWFGWAEALAVADPGLVGLIRCSRPVFDVGGASVIDPGG